jgi:hypothetical protein
MQWGIDCISKVWHTLKHAAHVTHWGIVHRCQQVDFLINRLNALEEHMKAVEEQMALELDHRLACGHLALDCLISSILLSSVHSSWFCLLCSAQAVKLKFMLLLCRRNELVASDLLLTAIATAFAFVSMVGELPAPLWCPNAALRSVSCGLTSSRKAAVVYLLCRRHLWNEHTPALVVPELYGESFYLSNL